MENTEPTPSPRCRRTATAAVAAVLALALVLTGTFAWNATANKVNRFISKPGDYDKSVVLHDDFDGINKNVYVENTSESANVFVRVKLQEFMDLTSYDDRDPANKDWTTHIPKEEVGDCGLANASSEKFHDHFAWTMGGQKWYLPQAPKTGGTAPSDLNDYDATTPGAKQTPNAQVVSMKEYMAMAPDEKKAFVGWVYDADGWAYWSRPLPAGEATGLLLQRVFSSIGIKYTDHFYAINVVMESVDKEDLPMWTVASGNNDGLGKPSVTDGAQVELGTADAANMLEAISDDNTEGNTQGGPKVTKVEVASPPTKSTYLPGETFDPSGIALRLVYDDGSARIASGLIFTFEPYGALAEGTTSITINYRGFTTEVPIVVSPLA